MLGPKFKAMAPYLNVSNRLLKFIFMCLGSKANFT